MYIKRPPASLKGIAAAGEAIVDITLYVPDAAGPVEDGQVEAAELSHVVGGCAGNVALGAKLIGAPSVRVIGHKGNDEMGRKWAAQMTKRKIDLSRMVTRGKTARCVITEWPSKSDDKQYRRNQVFSAGGAASLNSADVQSTSPDAIPRCLQGVGVLVLNMHHFTNQATEGWALELAERASKNELTIFLDMSSAYGLMVFARRLKADVVIAEEGGSVDPDKLKAAVSEMQQSEAVDLVMNYVIAEIKPNVISMNMDEWVFLGGQQDGGRDLSQRIRDSRVEAIVAHRGTQPTLIFDNLGNDIEPVAVASRPALREVGAGDYMVGGMAAALMLGTNNIKDLVKAGHRAAARCVSTPAISLDGPIAPITRGESPAALVRDFGRPA